MSVITLETSKHLQAKDKTILKRGSSLTPWGKVVIVTLKGKQYH